METPANEEQESQLGRLSAHDDRDGSLPPFPPRPEPDASHSNGWDVAGQYRAIQEAQMLHEETLKQLREEVQYQKERLSELSDGAGGAGRTPQLDAVFLRLSELERKIGQDAPDPLLNEIVHRLAALENNPRQKQAGKDSRVDELIEQVERLRRKSSEPVGDSRVDDVVLRIASLESAGKRTNVASELEGLNARLQQARAELEESRRSDLSVFQQELQTLTERVQSLADEDPNAERLEAVDRRLEEISQSSAEARIELENKIDAAIERLPDQSVGEEEAAQRQALQARLEALEAKPAPATQEGLAEISEQLSALRFDLNELRERAADSPSPQRLLDMEARLEEVAEKLLNPEPDEETAALRDRVFTLEERLTGEDGLGGRLSAVEELARKPVNPPQEWVEKIDRIHLRLDGLEEIADRVAKLEELDDEPNQTGLLELTSRLRSLEIKGEELDDVSALISGLRSDLDEVRDGGPVGELRSELEALKEQSAKDESEELRARVQELASRLSDIESVNRIESTGSRLDALEEKLRGLDDLTDVRRRLTVLEMGSRAKDPSQTEELALRLEALEARPATAEVAPDLSAIDARLEALQARLEEVEAHPASALRGDESSDDSWRELLSSVEERLSAIETSAPSGPDADRLDALSARLAELESRADAKAEFTVDTDARARLEAIADDLEHLKQSAADSASSQGGSDPRVSELIDRLDWMENSARGASADLDPLRMRLEALELREHSGPVEDDAVRLRMQEVLDRLDTLEAQGPSAADGALQKESERWSQWARSTLEEIGELRRQIEALEERPATVVRGGAAGLDAEAVEALGMTISSGLAKGEVRSLRQQMYFIYFAIGTLLALAVLFLFMNLTS